MMRKYIIGFMVGAALTFAVQAGASSLLDSKINAVIEVEVDGVSLGQAPVINGVSYLPVRKFGNAVGYNVNFGEGKATLTSNEAENAVEKPEAIVDPVDPEPAQNVPEHNYTLQTIEDAIYGKESAVRAAEVMIKVVSNNGTDEAEIKRLRDGLVVMKKELDDLKDIKAQLESQ